MLPFTDMIMCYAVPSPFESQMFVDKIEVNMYKTLKHSLDGDEVQDTTVDDRD